MNSYEGPIVRTHNPAVIRKSNHKPAPLMGLSPRHYPATLASDEGAFGSSTHCVRHSRVASSASLRKFSPSDRKRFPPGAHRRRLSRPRPWHASLSLALPSRARPVDSVENVDSRREVSTWTKPLLHRALGAVAKTCVTISRWKPQTTYKRGKSVSAFRSELPTEPCR